mmetsp:Transcript_3205/g.8502  ORF Transcript_3205/g.8502 Transcript_3205/m.8502 type:complete len:624 (-) Transcript_3205:105-1976(-)
MQPLAYFAARSLLGWLQWMERADRAFVASAPMLVATGAAHCWAVVYALFIAIHTRAMRFGGYHEGYTEHLPFWVAWTENLAVGSMFIWWAACFGTAAIRIVDDDEGLPLENRDTISSFFQQVARSARLHTVLSIGHTLSCVGLFASIIMLCVAMVLMTGAITEVTACELCLCFISMGFAWPHAVVACRRIREANPKKTEDTKIDTSAVAAEAAAQEAAALGPQLCVILALADTPGHAYVWQNAVYLLSAIAYVMAVAACGRSPPKVGDAALPPETGEFVTCLALDAAAAISLVICFPHLNTWHLWILAALLAVMFVAVWFEGWRDMFVDVLDPLLVVRSDTDKALPGQQRQRLRRAAWATTLLCAAVALWDIMLHPVQEGLFEPADSFDSLDDGLADLWDPGSMLLLRWRQGAAGAPGSDVVMPLEWETQLLAAAAEALQVEESKLTTQVLLPEHRLLVFRHSGPADNSTRLPAQLHWNAWKAAMLAPEGKLGAIADSSFPPALNVTLCLHTHALADMEAAEKEKEAGGQDGSASSAAEGSEGAEGAGHSKSADVKLPEDFISIVGPSADAHHAYMAGCDWWTTQWMAVVGEAGHFDDEDVHDVHDMGGRPPQEEIDEGDDLA